MSAQKQVGHLLFSRGYTSKHATAWVVKSYLKMLEEVCELGRLLPIAPELREELGMVEKWAKEDFDTAVRQGDKYDPVISGSRRLAIEQEAADVQVTVFDLANGIGVMTGVGFDISAAAIDKATADIERGVRT
jgi:hypothetical protein